MDTHKLNQANGVANGFDFAPFDAGIVYVKPIDSSLVPGLSEVPPGTTVYAVHSSDGTALAVINSREGAFRAARQYNMQPVSVH